ncbi:hypothetical protein XI08_10870 [Bradyrhizobium sp. CCBAU 11361]|nr:hypothetical protein [Bradyrhizobium sp. CCBAU 11361]
MKPRGVAWNGAGGWLIFSQSQQVNSSRAGRLHEGADALRLRRCGLRGKLILPRRGGEFFEFQFHLLDQPRRALGALPVQFALGFVDPQLEMRDQRRVIRQLRLRAGSHRLGSQPGPTLGLQRSQGTCRSKKAALNGFRSPTSRA